MIRLAKLLIFAAIATGCGNRSAGDVQQWMRTELTARENRLSSRLAQHDSLSDPQQPLAHWILPPELNEVSGLALAPDGRLFAHDDEFGRISVIDPRRGVVLRSFALGDQLTRGDFEGMTVGNGTLYMVTSRGRVYEFPDGAPGEKVRYTVHDLRLGSECEIEGIAYDHSSESLVLPCKTVKTPAFEGQFVMYRWHLTRSGPARLSSITVPMDHLLRGTPWKSLRPTDITIEPNTGDYVMVAAQERALVQMTPSGEIVRAVSLPPRHAQAEGVAITRDGILIVSDEATNRAATITLYRWPLKFDSQPTTG
jgi:uncharacterized protein YjiK